MSRFNVLREICNKYPDDKLLDFQINNRNIYLSDKLWKIINTTLFI